MRYSVGVLGLLLLAGCAGVGPRTQDILTSDQAVVAPVAEEAEQAPFALVTITGETAKQASAALKSYTAKNFLPDAPQKTVQIGRSDVLDISIVTTSENGFIDLTNSTLSPISTTAFPPQEVGTDGMVSVPPLGRIRAQGQTVQGFERLLERRLGEVLVDPSVVVQIAERRSARVSVLGDVRSPGIYPINQNNMHLVEVLAEAGGPEGLSDELELTISRRGRTGQALLRDVYNNPRYNIHVQPGDVISVEAPQYSLTVLGAGSANGTLNYDDPELSLAEALAGAGGLLNRRADRKGVFVYRELPRKTAADLGVDVTEFGDMVPTVFNIDLSKPQSLFATQDFLMAENDLVYIANGTNEEINAVFSVFTNFAPTPAEVIRDNVFGQTN